MLNKFAFSMGQNINRVLFVNSEMAPYLPDSDFSCAAKTLAQGIQEKKVEIRSFMPRYGLINERKHQLHEVIRLSGMNIVIDDVDRPLIIKVASLPSARMQVYFIDNDDFFRRKALYGESEDKFFKDNGARAIFFARGVLETVKKLRWSPDVIHCSGWISHVLPIYLKKYYKDDPIFSSSKVVLNLVNDTEGKSFEKNFADAVTFQGIAREDVAILENPTGTNLAKLAIDYSDGVIAGAADTPEEVMEYAKSKGLPTLDFNAEKLADGSFVDTYHDFYNSL